MKLMCILIVSLLFLGGAVADEPRKIALLVGVSDYQSDKIGDLQFAENDIHVVGSQLKLMGFEVTSLAGKDATRKQTISTIDGFMEKASELESSDIAFVMFSGHGQQIRVREETARGATVTEVPYFCPVDSKHFDETKTITRGKSETQVAEELNFVSLNRVLRGLDESSNSLNNLLVVDACRNNPSKGKAAGISGTSATVPRGVNILFAAGSGEKSWESADEKIEHGVFTHFLIKGLQGDAKNRRDQVTWSRLASYLQDEVAYSGPKLAGDESRLQNPHSIINSTNLIVLGGATSDELIEKRLYESLRSPSDVFDIAELCKEKDFITAPVYAAMLLSDNQECQRGWEILRPHFDSPEFLSFVLSPINGFKEGAKSHDQLETLSELIMLRMMGGQSNILKTLNVSDKEWQSRLVRLANGISSLDFKYRLGISVPGFEEKVPALESTESELRAEWEQIYLKFESEIPEAICQKFKKAVDLLESNRKTLDRPNKRREMIGKPFPEISGKDLQGNPISSRDFKDKILIVDLWAFW